MSALPDASREAFESAYKLIHPCPDLRRSNKGNYFEYIAEIAWTTWSASRKQVLVDVTTELEGMTCNSATARSAIKLCIETIKEMK